MLIVKLWSLVHFNFQLILLQYGWIWCIQMFGFFSSLCSINYYRYYISFIDAYNKFNWIYHLAYKSWVFDSSRPCRFGINLFNRNMKHFQSDLEVSIWMWLYFCSLVELFIEFPSMETHQQDSTVERKERHIENIGLSLLNHASVSLIFWSYAFEIADYTINMLSSSILVGKTPLETLFNHILDYSLLQKNWLFMFPFS